MADGMWLSDMKKREKSAVITTVATVYYTVISCFMPFVIRTLMIRYIGIEYLGVKGLFESILQVLNVVNFGVESAFFTFFLYKPCEDGDYDEANAILGLIRRFYLITGLVVFLLGLVIMYFLPGFVAGNAYPEDINTYQIFLFYIIHNVLSYVTGYLALIYPALLKSHVNALAWGTAFLFLYSFQAFAIVFVRDYTLYTAALVITEIVLALGLYFYNRIKLPWLTYKGSLRPDFLSEFYKRIPGMLISKIRNVSRNSLDCIIISNILGLTVLAQFQNYYQIMLVPMLMVGILNSSVQPALGNGISAESPESNYGILKQFTFVQNFAITVCMTCLMTLIQPFMKLWVGNDYLLGMDVVICVAVYFYVLCIASTGVVLRDTTGTWNYGKWVAVVETVLNIILNLVLIRVLGLSGIIIASIVTVVFINIPFELRYVFKCYFKSGYSRYMWILIKDAMISAGITAVSYFICIRFLITDNLMVFVRCFLAVAVPSVLFIIIHFNDEEFKETIGLIIRAYTALKNSLLKNRFL